MQTESTADQFAKGLTDVLVPAVMETDNRFVKFRNV